MTIISVSRNLSRANLHLKKGEFLEAKNLFSEVLMFFPSNVKARQGLKTLSETASNSFIVTPPQKLLNQLINLINEGKLELAVKQASNLSLYYPQATTLWNILGIASAQLKKFDQAIAAFEKIISLTPNEASAHYNLGNVYKDTGRIRHAVAAYTTALKLKPDYSEAYNNLSLALASQGEDIERQQLDVMARYQKLQVKDSELQEQLEMSLELFRKAIETNPDDDNAYYNMGNSLKLLGEYEEAIAAYRKGLAINPDNSKIYSTLGSTLRNLGDYDACYEALQKWLSIDPNDANANNDMGICFRDKGQSEAAIECYKKAIMLDPKFADAYKNLSTLVKFTPNDPYISKIEALLHDPSTSDEDRCVLHYAHAKLQEDLGNFGDAFDSYVAGGKLRQNLLSYEFNNDKLAFNALKSAAPQFPKIAEKLTFDKSSQVPIFILGMPRSGTTLVEQIVSAHADVYGAGELSYVSKYGAHLAAGRKNINTSNLKEFRRQYLFSLAKRANGESYVTDKMPFNFRFVSLICAAIPEAKIIHVKRNAAATCWSNFKHHFSSEGIGYSYDLYDTVKYYGLYSDLMNFWQKPYGNRIYTLEYDTLTDKQEPEIRKLIEFLGLSWDEACLAPEKNQRSVSTASQQQVRKKIYKDSSQAWRKYEPYINGAFDNLK